VQTCQNKKVKTTTKRDVQQLNIQDAKQSLHRESYMVRNKLIKSSVAADSTARHCNSSCER